MKLDLGCGPKCKEGYTGVDISTDVKPDVVLDLFYQPWPWEDNSIEAIYTSHVIEHIPMEYVPGTVPHKDLMVKFFENCYRILQPDGILEVVAPACTHETAFGDPTHRRFITHWLWRYLNKEWRDQGGLTHYGIECNFKTIEAHRNVESAFIGIPDLEFRMKHDWNVVAENNVIMKAIKP